MHIKQSLTLQCKLAFPLDCHSMNNLESAEKCAKSIEECLSACNTDSIKRAGNLFLNKNFDLNEKYVALTNEKLDAQVEKVDYSNSVTAAGIINGWVSEKTDGLIDSVISPEMISEETLMTLVTAILFKGKWKEKFHPAGKRVFRSISGKTNEVEVRGRSNLWIRNVFEGIKYHVLDLLREITCIELSTLKFFEYALLA